MDALTRTLLFVLSIQAVEIIAACLGLYYLKKKSKVNKVTKQLVYLLWVTVFVELIGTYTLIAYFSDYQIFGFVKDTVFERNYWLFNVYLIYSFAFYSYYFSSLHENEKTRKRFYYAIVLFVVTAIINLFFSDTYFTQMDTYIEVAGTLLILVTTVSFYFSLLKSDTILNLKRYLPIYISIGVLVFNLCISPLEIFSQYYKAINPSFVNLRITLLLVANIFMYGMFSLGFIVCSKKSPLI